MIVQHNKDSRLISYRTSQIREIDMRAPVLVAAPMAMGTTMLLAPQIAPMTVAQQPQYLQADGGVVRGTPSETLSDLLVRLELISYLAELEAQGIKTVSDLQFADGEYLLPVLTLPQSSFPLPHLFECCFVVLRRGAIQDVVEASGAP